jgi:hypothetical protein
MSSHSTRVLLEEPRPTAAAGHAQIGWAGSRFPLPSPSEFDREQRVVRALGARNGIIPRVDEATLLVYYGYLAANLSLPLVAYLSKPDSAREAAESRCVLVELIDPVKHDGSAVDGIFGKTRSGDCEATVPLIDLYLPEESPDFQIVEDYWYWFWNWQQSSPNP